MSNSEKQTHELKTCPEPFRAVYERRKKHEIRKADRPFKVGDELYLREWDPKTEAYSGNECRAEITYLTEGGAWDLPADLCVMSIDVFSTFEPSDED